MFIIGAEMFGEAMCDEPCIAAYSAVMVHCYFPYGDIDGWDWQGEPHTMANSDQSIERGHDQANEVFKHQGRGGGSDLGDPAHADRGGRPILN
jgi:hypothetical protein